MQKIKITGQNKLSGEIRVQGAKNSALPILAACVGVRGKSLIHNCPCLTDVDAAIDILKYLGCKVRRFGESVEVDSTSVTRYEIKDSLMHAMRSSIVFLGPLLSRCKKAVVFSPGGCEIGLRPIDLHLSALSQMGAQIKEEGARIECTCPKELSGQRILLSFPSVGATENIMLAAATAKGTTTLINAAREPEIYDLALFLNRCGAKIKGAGTGTVVIEGVKVLYGCEHRVIPDRIVASTFIAAAGATGSELSLKNVNANHAAPVISAFEEAGLKIKCEKGRLNIKAPEALKRVKRIRTMPYPGFPTDSQAIIMAMLIKAQGTSMFIENIFENRYRHVAELRKLGAKIEVEGKIALVEGTNDINGARVTAPDLRGGGALVIAGLCAQGETVIENACLLDRGWQNIESNLRSLGADIVRVRD